MTGPASTLQEVARLEQVAEEKGATAATSRRLTEQLEGELASLRALLGESRPEGGRKQHVAENTLSLPKLR